MMQTTRSLMVIMLCSLLLLLTACSKKPWVRPYDRLNLAEPVMLIDRDPIESGYLHHVYQAREGSRGAEGGTGGGCGCN